MCTATHPGGQMVGTGRRHLHKHFLVAQFLHGDGGTVHIMNTATAIIRDFYARNRGEYLNSVIMKCSATLMQKLCGSLS